MKALAALLALFASPALVPTEDLVYVAGTAGPDGASVLRELAKRAAAHGFRLSDAASANLYITSPDVLAEVEGHWGRAFGKTPPARTVLLARLEGEARVAVSLILSRVGKRSVEGGGVVAGDTLFLPGLAPLDTTVGIEEQTRSVMRQQQAILDAAGLRFADLTLTRIYLSDPKDYAGLNSAYREFVTAPPPARATVNSTPLRPGERVRIQSVAVRGSGNGRPSGEGITSPIHSYSVMAGPRLYITGMTGRRADGTFARDDVRAQAEVSLATIEEQLTRHQMSFRNVVDTLVWLRRPEDGPAAKQAIEARLGGQASAITVVGIPPSSVEALIEIQMVAYRRGAGRPRAASGSLFRHRQP